MKAQRTIPWLLGGLCCLTMACATAQLTAQGDEHVQQGNWDEAIVAYEQALASSPDDQTLRGKLQSARRAGAGSYHLRGREAEASFDLNAALASYDRALVLQPSLDAARTDRSKARRMHRMMGRAVDRARGTLDRGDCVSAKVEFEALIGYAKTFPAIEAGRVEAMRHCVDRVLALASVKLRLGQVEAAASLLGKAEALFPGHPRAATLKEQLEGKESAARLLARGRVRLAGREFGAAVESFEEGLKRDPRDDEARSMLAAARRLAVSDQLTKARKQRKDGVWQKELARLQAALALKPVDEALRARISGVATALRKGTAARLYQRAEAVDAAGLFGAAWIYYRLADLVGRPFLDANLKARTAVARIEQVVPYRILVVPPAHDTDWYGLSASLTTELVGALAPFLEGTRVTLTLDANAESPPDGILRGKWTEFSLSPPKVQMAPLEIGVSLSPKRLTNPKLIEAYKGYIEASAEGSDEVASATALKVLQGQAATVTQEPEQRKVQLPRARATVEASGAVELELYDRANDRVVSFASADAITEAVSEATAALASADRKAQAFDLPKPAALRRRLELDIVDELVEQLGPALRLAGIRFERLAERVKGDARLHYVVLSLVAGTPNAEALKQEVLDATGYRHGEDNYDSERLRF